MVRWFTKRVDSKVCTSISKFTDWSLVLIVLCIMTCLGDFGGSLTQNYTIFHVMYHTCFMLNLHDMRHMLDSNAVFSRNLFTCMLI